MDKQENKRRYEILGECLSMVEAHVRYFSRNQAMIAAKPGYEQAWEKENEKRQTLQKMMQELREAGLE